MKSTWFTFFSVLLLLLNGACKFGSGDSEPSYKEIKSLEYRFYSLGDMGLPADAYLYNIAIDHTGNKWMTTLGYGVVKYDVNGMVTVYDASNSPLWEGESVWSLAVDNGNRLWVGTNNRLLSFDGHEWQVFDHTNSPLPNAFVPAIAVDADDVLWIACGNSETGGIVRFDGTGWTLYTMETGVLTRGIIKDIMVDHQNTVWVSPLETDLMKFENGQFTRLKNTQWSSVCYGGRTLSCDKKGNTWIGYDGAYSSFWYSGQLVVYNGSSWELKNPSDSGLVQYDKIRAMVNDPYDNLWVSIGLAYKLAMYNGEKWVLIDHINPRFPPANIQDMAFDADGQLWATIYVRDKKTYGLASIRIEWL